MFPRWLRRLFGAPSGRITKQTLSSYRASHAQYVAARTFHSNVQHWFTKADEALCVIQEDGEFDRATHPMTGGRKPTDMELWFADKDYHIRPADAWPILMSKHQMILTALTHTTPSTQDYYRRMTKGLTDDLVVIETALFDVEAKYEQHQRTVKRYR